MGDTTMLPTPQKTLGIGTYLRTTGIHRYKQNLPVVWPCPHCKPRESVHIWKEKFQDFPPGISWAAPVLLVSTAQYDIQHMRVPGEVQRNTMNPKAHRSCFGKTYFRVTSRTVTCFPPSPPFLQSSPQKDHFTFPELCPVCLHRWGVNLNSYLVFPRTNTFKSPLVFKEKNKREVYLFSKKILGENMLIFP